MNLREVVRSGYKVFNRMNEEKRKAHILALQYIELLASQTNTKMEPWDISQVFGTGKGNELTTDKKEINQRFFAKVEELKSKTPAQVFAVEERISSKMDAITRGLNERQAAELVRNYESEIARANRVHATLQAHLVAAAKIAVSIDAIERRESTVSQQIAQILQENFWEFHQLTGNVLELVTRGDVLLSHKNSAQSLDLRVNLGRFKTLLDLANMTIKIGEFEGNVKVGGYIHPHISSGGDICWGNAGDTVFRELPKGGVAEVLRLLASILTNYNNNSPYINLARFQELSKNDAPPKDKPPEYKSPGVFIGPSPPPVNTFLTPQEVHMRNPSAPTAVTVMMDQSRAIGHPVDSSIQWASCLCRQCEEGRRSANQRSEFERLEQALTSSLSVGTSALIGSLVNPTVDQTAIREYMANATRNMMIGPDLDEEEGGSF